MQNFKTIWIQEVKQKVRTNEAKNHRNYRLINFNVKFTEAKNKRKKGSNKLRITETKDHRK